MKNLIKILALLLLLNLALFANAVGTITALSGSASILRGSESITATLGAKLEQKDIIKTADATKLQVIFSDDTIISIGKNSNFSIDEFLFDESAAPVAKFGLLSGAMRTITGKIGKVAPDKFSVKTKTATIGIRGTNFSIFAQPDGSAKVFCTFGAISVAAGGDTSVVSQGFFIQVSPDGARSEPIKFTPQELKEQQEESLGSTNDDSSSSEGSSSESAQTQESSSLEADSPVDTSSNDNLALVVTDITDTTSDSVQSKEVQKVEKIIAEEKEEQEKQPDPTPEPTPIPDPTPDPTPDPSPAAPIVMTGFGNHNKIGTNSYPTHDEVTPRFSINGHTLSEATIVDSDNVFWTYTIASAPTTYNSKNDFSYPIERITYSDDTLSNITLESTGNYFNAVTDLYPDDSMSWGDWGVSFSYESGGDVINSVKTGLWIAGEATPASVIADYKHGEMYATYGGIYRANFFIDPQTVELVNGTATLMVDFGRDMVSLELLAVPDKIAEITMIGHIHNGSNEFSGSCPGSCSTGNFNGMFYGADGKSAGGNFFLKDGNNVATAKGVYQVNTTEFTSGSHPSLP